MAIDSSYDYDYENDDALAQKLLDGLLCKDKESFKEAVKKASPFQLDKRYPELNHRTLLHRASEDPELAEFVTSLIDSKADINYNDFRQFKPIHYACESGNLKTLQILLKNGADVNAQNVFGDTPLRILVKNNFTDCTEELLKNESVNLNLKHDDEIHTCLDMAKGNGNEDIYNMLRDRGKEKAIPKRPDNEKMFLSRPMKPLRFHEQDYKMLSSVTIFLILFLISVVTAFIVRFVL